MRLRDKFIKKGCGTLMAVSSLPSKDGIGTFGIEAYKFIDFLRVTRQKYWQMLPIVCLGEGNSPYKSVSCFAGEPLYIDLNFLVRDGLLSPSHLKDMPNGKVDYKSHAPSNRLDSLGQATPLPLSRAKQEGEA